MKGESGMPISPTRTQVPGQFPPSSPHSTSLLAEPDAEGRRASLQGPKRHRDIEIAPGEDRRTGNVNCANEPTYTVYTGIALVPPTRLAS